MRPASIALWAVAASAVFALAMPAHLLGFRLVYNPTTSAPTGWYGVTRPAQVKAADYVLARFPPEAAKLANDRQYLPSSVPLLKRVGAVGGQQVCFFRNSILIDGRAVAVTLSRDRLGRELVPWRHCRALESDELFLLSTTNPASFDSRYFGPIRWRDVIGEAIPLWTW
jgi:conjugative transfer signal peptidase TraF